MSLQVLVVDDAAFMRMVLKNMLTPNGCEVVGEAGNGQEAISKYAELKPDLVTMDITMPELDGITAVKEIKKIDPQAKIIMCSAMGQQAMVIEAIQAGSSDFIVKPFKEDLVMEKVSNLKVKKSINCDAKNKNKPWPYTRVVLFSEIIGKIMSYYRSFCQKNEL